MRERRATAAATPLSVYYERFAQYGQDTAELERRQAAGRGLSPDEHRAELEMERASELARKLRTPLQIEGEIREQLGGDLADMMFTSYKPTSHNEKAALAGACAWVETYRAAVKGNTPRPSSGVVFAGGNGVGKTHLAVAMLRSVTDPLISIRFAHVPDFLDTMRQSFSDGPGSPAGQLIHKAKAVDVLVLDDLGQERATEWVVDSLGALVFHRHRACLPTIITTNLSVDEFEQRADGADNAAGLNLGAIYSRLRGQTRGNAYYLDGADHRAGVA